MAIYLDNATYIDHETFEFRDGPIEVTEGPEGSIRFLKTLPDPKTGDRVIGCSGRLVTKSFACGHHHVYSALARGMGAPQQTPANFHEILKYIWWTLDKNLDLEMIEASALVTAIYCAKAGTTFVVDHHASPFAVTGCLDTLASAFDRVGISHLLCYELSDRDGAESAAQGLAETEAFLASGRQGLVGLHASFTVGEDLLKKAVALAERFDSGIHVHVAEDPIDEKLTKEKFNKSIVDRFKEAGVLNFQKTIMAHVLHLDGQEQKLIKDSNAWVVENMESNLNNAVGVFDGRPFGRNVMLGTDGLHSDMMRSAKAAYFAGQRVEKPAFGSIYGRLRNVHRYLAENGFKGDSANNLIILNYDAPTEINRENFLGHFVFGIDRTHVESVISGGRLILDHGKVTQVDEDEVFVRSKELATRLWKKMEA